AVTYMLGMDPRAVFPIMATSGALMLIVAATRFYRSGRFNRRVALGLTLGGVPGVLVAAYLVKTLDVTLLLWLVVGVLLYTSVVLYRSSQTPRDVTP
ncbi:MAG: TSUP family transporter, partial [Gemmatimonadota bacterium]